MSGTNRHYQPAALIGGFGRPAPSGKLREARVAVRRKATGAVDNGFPKADRLAYRPGMYRLASPPAGVDPDVVDRLWDPVETGLRDLAVRLAARRLQPGDDRLLFDYAATAGVRHPSFEAVAADHQTRQGLPALQGDELQYERVLALGNQRPVMPAWRWRVLHSPADAPRFMLTALMTRCAWAIRLADRPLRHIPANDLLDFLPADGADLPVSDGRVYVGPEHRLVGRVAAVRADPLAEPSFRLGGKAAFPASGSMNTRAFWSCATLSTKSSASPRSPPKDRSRCLPDRPPSVRYRTIHECGHLLQASQSHRLMMLAMMITPPGPGLTSPHVACEGGTSRPGKPGGVERDTRSLASFATL